MSTSNHDEKPSVTPHDIEVAVKEVLRLEPVVLAGRKAARLDLQDATRLAGKVQSFEFRLKLRGVQNDFELWPIGLMIVPPFAVGGLLFILGLAFDLGAMSRIVGMLLGVSVTALICFNLLWSPPTAEIRRQLPQLRSDLVVAQSQSKRSNEVLQRIEKPYLEAKQRHAHLQHELKRFEEQQKRLAIQRKQDEERRKQEEERRAEIERQRLIASAQYKREQLYNRNWKAMRSQEFEEFLREVFLAIGYEAETTKVTGDQGVDLLIKDGARKIAVQVKGYVNSVSNSAVQEAYAGMGYYRCHACVVIANSLFTASAIELANRLNCTLIDENQMHDFIMGNLRV